MENGVAARLGADTPITQKTSPLGRLVPGAGLEPARL